jgi:hypothetical protein
MFEFVGYIEREYTEYTGTAKHEHQENIQEYIQGNIKFWD